MEKKELFRIMAAEKYGVSVVKAPAKTLAMIKLREPVKNSLFYLGEALVCDTVVELGGTKGTAVVMGDDFDKVSSMAVIDAAFNRQVSELDELKTVLQRLSMRQQREQELENGLYAKTMVDFQTMDQVKIMQKAYEFDFVYDTQAAFRLLLEALSNPGRIVELGPLARKLGGAYAMPLTVAAVLLDNEVSFAVCGSPALAEKITELTLAKTAAVSKADYIFVTENADWQEAVQAAKCGTLRDPHKSATVILCTADLQAGKLQRISGPGIKAVQEIIMCPELQAALGKRDEQEYEYPLGLDFFVLDQRGCLMGIPRKTRIESR